jgi:hypothetical protein
VFNGVSKTIKLDNLKADVNQAYIYTPLTNLIYQGFVAQWRFAQILAHQPYLIIISGFCTTFYTQNQMHMADDCLKALNMEIFFSS